MAIALLAMDWPLPRSVGAAITLRDGGYSAPPYAGANMGDHVGDLPAAVAANRAELQQQLALPSAPLWLNQVHSADVVDCSAWRPQLAADGLVSQVSGQVCVAMGADCLTLLLCNCAGSQVAAVHVGWRGLAAGVVEAALDHFNAEPLLAYLGPAIGSANFEVGAEVRTALLSDASVYEDQSRAEAAFTAVGEGQYLADLAALVRERLARRGRVSCFGGNVDTFAEPQRCFSHRRDGVCGRHAALIWRR